MLTVDVQVAGVRERDVRNRFSVPPRITARTLAQGITHPRWSAGFLARPRMTPAQPRLVGEHDQDARERRQPRVRPDRHLGRPRGPARALGRAAARQGHHARRRRAALRGASASTRLVVSNHGGRQLDGAAASIDALPAIADAVGDRAELLLDSGVRRGTDIVKALALGARAVLIGRPLVYGLGAAGEAGAPPRVRDPRGGAARSRWRWPATRGSPNSGASAVS